MPLSFRWLSAALALSLAAPLAAQAPPLDKPRMLQVVQNYVDNRTFMGSVLVAQGGRVILDASFGSANLDWSLPNTAHTRFRIGSLTKQFTAAGILLLQQQGKLSLQQPIRTYLPDTPDAWAGVTVYHLLTHTSGIPNFTADPAFDQYKRQPHSPQDSLALVRDKPLDFAPGARFAYSNTNYILLGQILERVSGQPYADFLRQNIFAPLGMRETGVDNNTAIVPQRAQGYDPTPDGFRPAPYIDMSVPYAAGFLYSTTGDLLLWQRALFTGKLLSPASLRLMTTPNLGDYGMGLFIHTANHRTLITHDGTIEGFETSLNHYPQSDLSIIVLGNVRTDAPQKIAAQLAKVAFGEPLVLNSDRKVVDLPASVLAAYAGHYSAPPFSTTLSVENGRLIATAPNGHKFTLWAQSPTSFFLKEIDVQLEFTPDPATGKITGFTMTQDGATKQVKRDQ